ASHPTVGGGGPPPVRPPGPGRRTEMTRVAKLVFGTLIVVAVAIVAVCTPQTPREGGYIDTKVDLSSDGKTITASPAVALVSRAAQAKTPFKWVIGTLPEGSTLEIDFRVQGTQKGPFKRAAGATWPMGRYAGGSGSTITTGPLLGEGREVWKYDVVLRDKDGNDLAATDPVVVIME